ncbi:N-acetylmuramoyl-L-alanine amidase family protein [Pseudoramibacter alactolyticus]|uniref:N-acetylmuramoyl-L-alanine amidase family protein n=1 Tax=Pseudoramibacter alactolyticus TaxID=113287 RepID=UPI00248F2CAD|nr:N-acetylmuramoyl-L-alanine amidase [Pseudoramibacter alactolyticus]
MTKSHAHFLIALMAIAAAVALAAVGLDWHQSAAPKRTSTAKPRKPAQTTPKTTPASNPGAGKTIVLDPGHSAVMPAGTEPIGPGSKTMKAKDASGTRGTTTGVTEYAFMMTLARKLVPVLESRGYKVILTRKNNQTAISCAARAQVANNAKADAFVRLHANGVDNAAAKGALAICITPRNPYTAGTYQKSRLLSEKLLNTYCQVTGAENNGITEEDNMTGNNWAKVPTTLIEVGYMTNPEEDRLMQTDAYQIKIVNGIVGGLDAYFKN